MFDGGTDLKKQKGIRNQSILKKKENKNNPFTAIKTFHRLYDTMISVFFKYTVNRNNTKPLYTQGFVPNKQAVFDDRER